MGRITWSLPHYCKWSATCGRWLLPSASGSLQSPLSVRLSTARGSSLFSWLYGLQNRFSACFVLFFNKQPGCQQETTHTPNRGLFREVQRNRQGTVGCPQAVSTRNRCHPEASRGKRGRGLPRQPCCLPASASAGSSLREVWRGGGMNTKTRVSLVHDILIYREYFLIFP